MDSEVAVGKFVQECNVHDVRSVDQEGVAKCIQVFDIYLVGSVSHEGSSFDGLSAEIDLYKVDIATIPTRTIPPSNCAVFLITSAPELPIFSCMFVLAFLIGVESNRRKRACWRLGNGTDSMLGSISRTSGMISDMSLAPGPSEN